MLAEKVVLITGAAGGIGRAAALRMAEEGADVGVADILPEVEETAREVERIGRRSASAVIDVSDPEAVRKGVEKIRLSLGDIGILVNNAGIVNNVAPLTKMTNEAWQREISVNLSGAFYMIKEVIGPMIDKQWGRIINISSLAATDGLHRQAAYAASKAGLLGLTKTVTLEHARDGITCNAILPWLIRTHLVEDVMPEEIRRNAISTTPARRLGTLKEMTDLIVFLASDNSSFINGIDIHIDGGARLNVNTLGSVKEIREMEEIRRAPLKTF